VRDVGDIAVDEHESAEGAGEVLGGERRQCGHTAGLWHTLVMGRHSAPRDEDVNEPADAGLTLVTGDADEARGRHTRDEATAVDTATDVIDEPPAEATAPTGPIVPVNAAPDEAPAKKESNTQADLRMLREDPVVRWLVLAAVLVSFALYTVVMLAFGRLSDYAYWVWIPVVLSGVLVGAVLDWAHHRAKRVG
jgi:hypothetical protein